TISGSSSSINIDTTNLTPGNHTVSVTVTGTCGSVTKSATLVVNPSTTASLTATVTGCNGDTQSFSGTASGAGTLTFAWSIQAGNNAVTPLNNNPGGGVTITGTATTSSLSLDTSLYHVDSLTTYTVILTVTGTCGTVNPEATFTLSDCNEFCSLT